MPSRKPRCNLIIAEDLWACLVDYADAMQKPVSTTITILLREMQPQLPDLARMARAQHRSNLPAVKSIAKDMLGRAYVESVAMQQQDIFNTKKARG
jgi:hypothetical protein